MKNKLLILLTFAAGSLAYGQEVPSFFKSAGSPADPKVKIMWNRYYSSEGLADLC
jgi:hypothetical protein